MNQDTQDLLTRIGPGTGMGALLRRYWHPVAGSAELAPGEARKVRLLGEDLALFRTASGRLGLLEESCPHRRASLAYRGGGRRDHPLPLPRLDLRRRRP
nr:Rieske 2Fe-2S domain-containing protein [uncultured Thiohalocapsa sp.]